MDLSRPAIAQSTDAWVRIEHRGRVVADTRAAVRTLKTSHPPSYYIPLCDIAPGVLRRAEGTSFCEWKGGAAYWDIVVAGLILPRVGWSYADPTSAFAALREHVAFYAAPFDRCSVDGEHDGPAAWRLLRRLDHVARGRVLQGRPWQPMVLTQRAAATATYMRSFKELLLLSETGRSFMFR